MGRSRATRWLAKRAIGSWAVGCPVSFAGVAGRRSRVAAADRAATSPRPGPPAAREVGTSSPPPGV
eukprot:15466386-Alexandrium_andersonii.AAC.1